MPDMRYAIADEDGNVEFVVPTSNAMQAAEVGAREGWDVQIDETADYEPLASDLAASAADLVENEALVGAELAWERTGFLQIHREDVDRMSLEEAHQRLVPFFPRLRRDLIARYPVTEGFFRTLSTLHGGAPIQGRDRSFLRRLIERGWATPNERLTEVGEDVYLQAKQATEQIEIEQTIAKAGEFSPAWRTPDGMVDNLLGQNYKTGKEFPLGDVEVMGLSLVPASMWSQSDGRNVGVRVRRSPNAPPVWQRGARINLCVGASIECIRSCLVYSGHNETDVYNIMLKQAKTSALLLEPTAFGRILLEACRRHRGTGRRVTTPMVRLNVYSDIPWELVFPSLFEDLPDMQFYDYTKVADREMPSNYDMTFSYSGRNESRMLRELGRGRKAAVVFLDTHRYADARARKFTPRHAGLPDEFLGYEVVDGDISDIRPLDGEIAEGPPPYVVGLSWKAPKGRASGVDPRKLRFAVPVEEIEGRLVASIVPRDQPDTSSDADVAAEDSELIAPERLQSGATRGNRKQRSTVREDVKRKLMRP